ncbi:MAG: PadR family transcriptional regulator [Halobacteriota archaeon]
MNHYKIYHNCGPMHHMPSACKTWLAHPRRDRGNLSLLILEALQEQPLLGYGIIKAIEEKRGYAPDPASLYPTLQLLQDQGYVKAEEKENKKVYALTDEGKTYLKENSERIDRMSESLGQFKWNSLPGVGKRVASLAGTIFSNYSYLDDAKIKRIEELLDETRKRVGDIVFEN